MVIVENQTVKFLLRCNDLQHQLYTSIVAPKTGHFVQLKALQLRKVLPDCLENVSCFLHVVCEVLEIELFQTVLGVSRDIVHETKYDLPRLIGQIVSEAQR